MRFVDSAFVLSCFSLIGVAWAVDAKNPAPAMTDISAQGVTRLSDTGKTGAVAVALVTRVVSSPEDQPNAVTRCSGGRVHCSVVDKLTISVGGKALEVPQRAVLLLADVNRGRVFRLDDRHFELMLDCGDAAAGYEARLFFDGQKVSRLEIWAGEAEILEQATTYKDLSHAFN